MKKTCVFCNEKFLIMELLFLADKQYVQKKQYIREKGCWMRKSTKIFKILQK